MKQNIKNIILVIISLSAILYWLFVGWNTKIEITENKEETTNHSDLIFQLIQQNSHLEYHSLIGVENISFSDSTNFTNILKKQNTHPITIDEIAPYTTTDFLSLSYNKTTLNNYKTYLKNNNKLHEWDSVSNSFKTAYDFNILELSSYITEIGSFTCNTSTFYYLKSEEAYNVVILLNLIMDSITPQITKRLLFYKINTDNIFQLLAGELFTENKSYHINTGDYFIFGSDTAELSDMYYHSIDGNTLEHNPLFSHYKSKQHSEYGLHYYSDITIEKDSLNRILSYQLRGEQNGVISNFNIFYSKKILDTIIIDTIIVDTTLTEEEILIDDIVNTTIQSQEKEDLGEIMYILKEGETFRQATVNLEKLLEENGYDYQKIKTEHLFFFTNNGNTKLDWTTAVKKYLDKKIPEEGDYFFMEKFYF